jgi:hypothetical protein
VNGSSIGEPSSKLLELFAKTVVPEPYPVTDKIVISPPTQAGREQLNKLHNEKIVGQFYLTEAFKHPEVSAKQIQELTKIVEDADKAYNELFFGPHYDDIRAFFAGRPPAQWDAFCADVRAQFNPPGVTGPATGACPHCGTVVDEEQAGKGSALST